MVFVVGGQGPESKVKERKTSITGSQEVKYEQDLHRTNHTFKTPIVSVLDALALLCLLSTKVE